MRYILFNNEPFAVTDELRKEYYANCGEEGTDEEVYDFFEDKFDFFLTNLKYPRDKKGERIGNVPVIITGKLTHWDGVHTIKPLIVGNIECAVRICTEKCDYCMIYKEFSKIVVEATHHDGINVFTLQFLNDVGEARHLEGADVDFTNRRYIRTLGEYLY